VKAWAYNLMYRYWAPWDGPGVRRELVDLLESGRVDPERYPRSIDLGCGSGTEVVYLAEKGFDSWGVDFSDVGLEKAKARAADAGVSCSLVQGDLTAGSIDGVEGPFDLLVDFGTFDDLRGEDRKAAVETANRLSRPGSVFLEWCFYGRTEDLPAISFSGPSRAFMSPDRARRTLSPAIEPGEIEMMYGQSWEIEPVSANPERCTACFLLTRKP
jgi:SAM-dependent methyltransferase